MPRLFARACLAAPMCAATEIHQKGLFFVCPKQNIRLMLTISCLQGMVFYSSIATLYRQAAGIGVFQISVIECLSMALSLLLEFPWGVVAERIGTVAR